MFQNRTQFSKIVLNLTSFTQRPCYSPSWYPLQITVLSHFYHPSKKNRIFNNTRPSTDSCKIPTGIPFQLTRATGNYSWSAFLTWVGTICPRLPIRMSSDTATKASLRTGKPHQESHCAAIKGNYVCSVLFVLYRSPSVVNYHHVIYLEKDCFDN